MEDDEFGFSVPVAAAFNVLAENRASAEFMEDMKPVLAELLRTDVTAPDVVAFARRRAQLDRFAAMLSEDHAFETDPAASTTRAGASGDERKWQAFFEENPWIFGTGLAPQFLHAWDPERLEQTVLGASVASPGKRPDALMRTAGALSALVLVEIKSHRAPLVGRQYRNGVWPPSADLTAGVAQCQSTLDAAVASLGPRLDQQDADGFDTDAWAALCRPRSLLVMGSLHGFFRNGNANRAQFESFERFRRSLTDPEIVTYDELYERARLALELADTNTDPSTPETATRPDNWGAPFDTPSEAPF